MGEEKKKKKKKKKNQIKLPFSKATRKKSQVFLNFSVEEEPLNFTVFVSSTKVKGRLVSAKMTDNGDDGENIYPDIVNRWNGRLYSKRFFEMLEWRMMKLRVWCHRNDFWQVLKDNQTLILSAETGSGKTTQIPEFVLEAVYDIETSPLVDKLPNQKMMVACTLPSHWAVMFFSRLVALGMDVTIGEEVGYKTDFEDRTSARTILKYIPDHLLLREALTDPHLKKYKVIILDEAHERTLVKDMLFGYLKNVLKHRHDLKLVVMTGTITENVNFINYFSAPLLKVNGGHHPVELYYLSEEPDEEEGGYLEEAIKTVVKLHMDEDPGDVLVFLAQVEEIEAACLEIINRVENMVELFGPVKVVPLSSMSADAMLEIYKPTPPAMEEGGPPGRKIVVTTNIAETSLTIRDIVYVVDCGYARQKKYNHQVHAEYVQVSPISKERAEERSRHAGRIRPGKCFRLYTQMMFNSLEPQTFPEIKRSNLQWTVLILKKLGIHHRDLFDFMDRPDPEVLIRAFEGLDYLGGLDGEWNLTRLGKFMSESPLNPQMSKMLLHSPEFSCSSEILTISAMLLAPDCFVHPNRKFQEAAEEAKNRFCHVDGDHITLLNVYNAYKQNIGKPSWCCDNFVNARALEVADSLRQQLLGLMSRFHFWLCNTDVNSREHYVNIRKAILTGFFMQVAHLNPSGQYFTVKDNEKVTLHPSSSQDHKPEWVVYNDYVLDTVWERNYIRTVTPVCEEWLVELVPHYWKNVKPFMQEGG